MNENSTTTKLIHALNSLPGCFCRKQHGGMFSSGDPDINGCYRGRALKIEVKVTGGILSPLQAEQMCRWSAAGAIVMLAVYDYTSKLFAVYYNQKDWSKHIGKTGHYNTKFFMLACKPVPWQNLLEKIICEPTLK